MKRSYLTNLLAAALLLGFTVLIPVSSSAAQPSRVSTDPPLLKKCWNYPSAIGEHGLAADSSRIFLGETNARIEAISVDTGTKLWTSDLGGTVASNILAGDKTIYVATRSVGTDLSKNHTTLWALSKETGLTVFSSPLDATGQITLDGAGQRIFSVSDGVIDGFDASTGATLWSRTIAAVSAEPVIADHKIILGTNDKFVIVVSVETGEITSRIRTKYIPTAVASPNAETIVVGDDRGNLLSVDAANGGTNWKLRQGARISEIDVNNDDVLVTSYDNFVYSIDIGSGKVSWKKRMAGRINVVPDSSRQIAVTLAAGENTAFVIDTKNGKSLNQLTLDGENAFVQEPIIAGNSAVFATADGVLGYSITGCSAK